MLLEHQSPAALQTHLQILIVEHRDLDEAIHRLAHTRHTDRLLLQRLKKRKLLLKDRIAQLEHLLTPDEPA